MKKKLQILLNTALFLIIGMIVFKVLSPMYDALSLNCDSLETPWESTSSFLDYFTKSDHCWFIFSLFWSMSLRFIPEFLRIHPMEWMTSFYYLILFGILNFLILAIFCNFSKYFKSKNLSILYVIPIYLIFFGFLNKSESLYIIINDCFCFAYFFLPIFSIVFLSETEKLYIKGNIINSSIIYPTPPQGRKIFILILLFLCVAISHEYSRFIICNSIFIVYILHYLFINKNFNHKKFWLMYVLIVTACCFIFILPEYSEFWLKPRLYSLTEIINNLPFYLKGYFKYNIVENSFLLFTIAFLAGISYIFFRKDTERKKITIFSTAITISALIFSLTTMIGTQNGQCSFEHFGIRLMTKIYLFNVVLSLLGWLISKLRYNSIKTYTVLLTFIFLFVTYKPISYIDEQYIEQSQQLKRRIFILERIFDLYGKDNKIYVWAFNNFCLLSPPAHLEYFLYLYDRENEYKNFDEYKPVKLCTNSDSYDDCDKKLVQFLKEKTGHELTEEEISKHNFQKYYKY